MEGLTAKVFRTYNASYTFQDQLNQLTPAKGTVAEKIAAYNKANKEVAILCNHQKTVSRTHGDSMAKLGDKVSPGGADGSAYASLIAADRLVSFSPSNINECGCDIRSSTWIRR
jgi:hypothetical protein